MLSLYYKAKRYITKQNVILQSKALYNKQNDI